MSQDEGDDSPIRRRNRGEGVRYAIALSVIAFLAHYAWETLHCPLFVHPPGETPMRVAMIRASLGDVGLTWIAQVSMAAVANRWAWPRGAGAREWLLLVALAAAFALTIEAQALATDRWSYTATNPLVPGLGLSVLPVAQLVVLFPLTFLGAARIAAARRRSSVGP